MSHVESPLGFHEHTRTTQSKDLRKEWIDELRVFLAVRSSLRLPIEEFLLDVDRILDDGLPTFAHSLRGDEQVAIWEEQKYRLEQLEGSEDVIGRVGRLTSYSLFEYGHTGIEVRFVDVAQPRSTSFRGGAVDRR
jgi:hypothetical protein